ncbi:TetR/AcrR family transcriptional regulator [Taibaiella chishuiensis]|uniref:TetR family transcriptional regulator n=1 Tax=Taibaiella chishuiensis TaxID=1434707 RepID=A0A2P8D1M5_9BACT|nr:TetR/AcrR family transcriptional regulator [Taibaiella chishuiensis]PSK91118.1 TetR family transcriptional regulator [Taibaiella chishuiensis]
MKKAAATRLMILEKAFELIYTKGYQTTSIDEIIATTQVTKGAFFYHFKSKDEMGLAIINELMKTGMVHDYLQAGKENEHPLDTIYRIFKTLLLGNNFLKVAYGCPAGNFTQEMAPWNESFRVALAGLVDQLLQLLTDILKKGKKAGLVNSKVHPEQAVLMIMSGYWGIRNFGKLYNSNDCYKSYLRELKNYLHSLR